jgi:hypothetical protein
VTWGRHSHRLQLFVLDSDDARISARLPRLSLYHHVDLGLTLGLAPYTWHLSSVDVLRVARLS